MLKDVGAMVLTDAFFTMILASFLVTKLQQTWNCSENLYWVGIGFVIYFIWFTVRNLAIILVCLCSKKPDDLALFSRMGCVFLDWILFTLFIVWSTMQLLSEESN